jgi:hypothetical protein
MVALFYRRNNLAKFLDSEKVFNTTVDNTVEKYECILLNALLTGASAFCTEAGAGTSVLQPSAKLEKFYETTTIGNVRGIGTLRILKLQIGGRNRRQKC